MDIVNGLLAQINGILGTQQTPKTVINENPNIVNTTAQKLVSLLPDFIARTVFPNEYDAVYGNKPIYQGQANNNIPANSTGNIIVVSPQGQSNSKSGLISILQNMGLVNQDPNPTTLQPEKSQGVNFMPFILIGVAILAIIVLLKRR